MLMCPYSIEGHKKTAQKVKKTLSSKIHKKVKNDFKILVLDFFFFVF